MSASTREPFAGKATLEVGDLLDVACTATAAAAAMLIEYRDDPGTIYVSKTGDVTTALDARIETVLREILQQAQPGVCMLGEEFGGDVHGTGWVIDPIDGTTNFVRRSPLCGVQLAFVEDSRPIVAVLNLPFLGECYTAVAGGGAYRNGVPVRVSTTASLREASACFDLERGEAAGATPAEVASRLATSCRRVGEFGCSGVELAWLASGVLDVVVLGADLPWDVLPGRLLVTEAGGVVSQVEDQWRGPEAVWTVATNAALYGPVERLLLDGAASQPSLAPGVGRCAEEAVRVTIVGVGNGASSLVQGVRFYGDADPRSGPPA